MSDPKWQEMKDVLEANGNFRVVGEATAIYPRELDKEPVHVRGRIKYQVINGDEKFCKKSQVLLYLAEMIPKLKTRKAGASGGQAGGSSEGSSTSGNTRRPKKGKK